MPPATETEAPHLMKAFPKTPRRSLKVPIALGFSLAGFATILYTGSQTEITHIPPTAQFGLLQILPMAYWFGLVLMGIGIAVALRAPSEALIVATGVLLFAAFAGTSVLFESNPSIWDSYHHFRESQFIGATMHIPTEPDRYAANWPGFFLIAWFLSQMGGFAPIAFLATYPFLAGGLGYLALFLFLRSLFPVYLAGAGSVIGSLFNVWAQFHVSPQSMGLFFFLLILATAWKRTIPWRVTNALLFVGLVLTHPTSILLLLSVLAVDLALAYYRKLPALIAGATPTPEGRYAFTPIATYAILWLGWLFFQARGSSQVAETVVLTRMGAILRIPESTANIATARTLENVWFWASAIRLAALAFFAWIGFLSLLLLWRKTRYRRFAQFLGAFLIGAIVFALIDIFAFRGQFYDRSFMLFALLAPSVGLTAAVVRGIPKAARVLIAAILLAFALACGSTIYYQESLYFVSDESVAVSQFLDRMGPTVLVVDGLYPEPIWRGTDLGPDRSTLAFYTIYPDHLNSIHGRSAVLAVFDDVSELWYGQYRGINILRFYVRESGNYSLIYANGQAEIFLIRGPASG